MLLYHDPVDPIPSVLKTLIRNWKKKTKKNTMKLKEESSLEHVIGHLKHSYRLINKVLGHFLDGRGSLALFRPYKAYMDNIS